MILHCCLFLKVIFIFTESVPLIDTHRDPFDRLIIATALFENVAILTADKQFDNYTSLVRIFK